jgi:hypothetical protein
MNEVRCPERCAECNKQCYVSGNHRQHDDREHQWDNADYIPPPPRVAKSKLREIVDSVDPEEIDENYVTMPREPKEAQKLAAWRVFPRSGTQRRKVFDAIASAWPEGLTEEEGYKLTGVEGNSWRARRKELDGGGWVEETPTLRLNIRGNEEHAWRLTPQAVATLGLSQPPSVSLLRDFG